MLIQPTNSVIVGDHGYILMENLKVETATSMVAGRLVEKGTNDDDIIVNPINNPNPVGWLSYALTAKRFRPALVTTAYAVGDWPVVVSGGAFRILASLAMGESVNKGDPLVGAALGRVRAADALTVTIATGTVAVVSDKAQPDEVCVGAYGSQGPIVCYAEQTVNATAAVLPIIVRSMI